MCPLIAVQVGNTENCTLYQPRVSCFRARYVDGEPVRSRGRRLQAELPAGQHRITFVTYSPVTNAPTKCSFSVQIAGTGSLRSQTDWGSWNTARRERKNE